MSCPGQLKIFKKSSIMRDDNHHDSGGVEFRRGGKLSAKRTLTVSNSFPTMTMLRTGNIIREKK